MLTQRWSQRRLRWSVFASDFRLAGVTGGVAQLLVVRRKRMSVPHKLRYRVFLFGLIAGGLSLAFWVFDYCVIFRPSWTATGVDRMVGFDAWFYYLSGHGLVFVALSVVGLWLACLMWLLPGSLLGGRHL